MCIRDSIKNMYDLNDKDVETIHDVNKILVVINDEELESSLHVQQLEYVH